jgi:hypothetical protein
LMCCSHCIARSFTWTQTSRSGRFERIVGPGFARLCVQIFFKFLLQPKRNLGFPIHSDLGIGRILGR